MNLLHLTHDERPELGGAFFTLRTETNDAVAIVLDPYETPDGDTAKAEEANAERLRDCWNACKPLGEDPAEVLKRLRTARARLEAGEDLCGHGDLLNVLMNALRDLGD